MPNHALAIAQQLAVVGVAVPEQLAAALEVLDAAANHPDPPAVDIAHEAMNVTAQDVDDLIARAVEARIRRVTPAGGGAREVDAVGLVRAELVERLEARALRVAFASADDIRKSLAKPYRDAADTFETAFRQLPARWENAEVLVHAGAQAVGHHAQAREAAVVLEACRAILKRITDNETDAVVRGCTFAACADNLVAEAAGRVPDSGSLGFFGGLLQVDGVTGLAWHDSRAEHLAYTRSLPQFEMKMVREHTSGFGVSRPTKVPA